MPKKIRCAFSHFNSLPNTDYMMRYVTKCYALIWNSEIVNFLFIGQNLHLDVFLSARDIFLQSNWICNHGQWTTPETLPLFAHHRCVIQHQKANYIICHNIAYKMIVFRHINLTKMRCFDFYDQVALITFLSPFHFTSGQFWINAKDGRNYTILQNLLPSDFVEIIFFLLFAEFFQSIFCFAFGMLISNWW